MPKAVKTAIIIANKNNKAVLLQFVTFSVSYKKTTINWQKNKADSRMIGYRNRKGG